MVDIYLMHTVAKATWIKRLSSVDQSHWKILFLKMMSVKDRKLNKRLDCTFSKKCATAFHEQVLESWTNVYPSEPVNSKDIVNEYILYNKYITVAKKL